MGMNKDHTVEELLAEIADSAAREVDVRNRAEVAEAQVARLRRYREMVEGLPVGALGIDDENVNPEVYRVEDGHMFEVSPWPSMEGKCHLCGHPETMHMQETL